MLLASQQRWMASSTSTLQQGLWSSELALRVERTLGGIMKSANHAGVRPRVGILSLTINETLRHMAAARRLASRQSILAASALGITASFIVPANAQDAAAGAPSLEEIVVTGSRIVRRDYESNSPIVTVNAEDFETQTGLNVEAYLNQMPQYNPAASPVTTDGDVQITPVNSVGIASISLRGFGPNRSLVLVDGKRMVPINPLMVTDINGIPSALIERVETITGGASAVYGADAVGGVTNFILKDDFEGFDVDFQTGMTQEGDSEESRISGVLGTNFSDGRGNVTVGFETYKREQALEVDHEVYQEWNGSPDTPGFFGTTLQGVNGYNCVGPECPVIGTINALFSDRPAGSNVFSPNGAQNGVGRALSFNPDGSTVFVNSRGGLLRADGSTLRYNGPVDGLEYVRNHALDNNVLSAPPGQPPNPPIPYDSLKWHYLDSTDQRAAGSLFVLRRRQFRRDRQGARERPRDVCGERHVDAAVRHERGVRLGNRHPVQPDDGQPRESRAELQGSRRRPGRS